MHLCERPLPFSALLNLHDADPAILTNGSVAVIRVLAASAWGHWAGPTPSTPAIGLAAQPAEGALEQCGVEPVRIRRRSSRGCDACARSQLDLARPMYGSDALQAPGAGGVIPAVGLVRLLRTFCGGSGS